MAEITIERRPEGGHRLRSELWLPRPTEEVFALFTDPGNLQELTPPWLRFKVLTPQPIEMREGVTIDYKLRVRMIPMRWRSEVMIWDPPHRFQDRQVRGPYRQWMHTHTFEERDGGTLVGDHVDYAVPGGRLVNRLIVERDVRAIFAYRQRKMVERFGA